MASRFPISVVLSLAGLSTAALLGTALPAPADPPSSSQRTSAPAASRSPDAGKADPSGRPSGRVQTPSRPAFQADEEALETILRVRRHYGSLLEGTVFESEDKSENERRFVEALREVMAEAEGRGHPRDSQKNAPVSASRSNLRADDLDRHLTHALELSAWLLEQKIGRLIQNHGSPSEIDRLERLLAQIRAELRETSKTRSSR